MNRSQHDIRHESNNDMMIDAERSSKYQNNPQQRPNGDERQRRRFSLDPVMEPVDLRDSSSSDRTPLDSTSGKPQEHQRHTRSISGEESLDIKRLKFSAQIADENHNIFNNTDQPLFQSNFHDDDCGMPGSSMIRRTRKRVKKGGDGKQQNHMTRRPNTTNQQEYNTYNSYESHQKYADAQYDYPPWMNVESAYNMIRPRAEPYIPPGGYGPFEGGYPQYQGYQQYQQPHQYPYPHSNNQYTDHYQHHHAPTAHHITANTPNLDYYFHPMFRQDSNIHNTASHPHLNDEMTETGGYQTNQTVHPSQYQNESTDEWKYTYQNTDNRHSRGFQPDHGDDEHANVQYSIDDIIPFETSQNVQNLFVDDYQKPPSFLQPDPIDRVLDVGMTEDKQRFIVNENEPVFRSMLEDQTYRNGFEWDPPHLSGPPEPLFMGGQPHGPPTGYQQDHNHSHHHFSISNNSHNHNQTERQTQLPPQSPYPNRIRRPVRRQSIDSGHIPGYPHIKTTPTGFYPTPSPQLSTGLSAPRCTPTSVGGCTYDSLGRDDPLPQPRRVSSAEALSSLYQDIALHHSTFQLPDVHRAQMSGSQLHNGNQGGYDMRYGHQQYNHTERKNPYYVSPCESQSSNPHCSPPVPPPSVPPPLLDEEYQVNIKQHNHHNLQRQHTIVKTHDATPMDDRGQAGKQGIGKPNVPPTASETPINEKNTESSTTKKRRGVFSLEDIDMSAPEEGKCNTHDRDSIIFDTRMNRQKRMRRNSVVLTQCRNIVQLQGDERVIPMQSESTILVNTIPREVGVPGSPHGGRKIIYPIQPSGEVNTRSTCYIEVLEDEQDHEMIPFTRPSHQSVADLCIDYNSNHLALHYKDSTFENTEQGMRPIQCETSQPDDMKDSSQKENDEVLFHRILSGVSHHSREQGENSMQQPIEHQHHADGGDVDYDNHTTMTNSVNFVSPIEDSEPNHTHLQSQLSSPSQQCLSDKENYEYTNTPQDETKGAMIRAAVHDPPQHAYVHSYQITTDQQQHHYQNSRHLYRTGKKNLLDGVDGKINQRPSSNVSTLK